MRFDKLMVIFENIKNSSFKEKTEGYAIASSRIKPEYKKGDMVIIVDGQNLSNIMSYLIVKMGVDFLDIVKAAYSFKQRQFIREAKIIYRDTLKGATQYQKSLSQYERLVKTLKSQGIEIMDSVEGINPSRQRTFDLDPLIKQDLWEAINDDNTKVIVLFSGDGHFAPYAAMARRKGIEIVIIANDGSLSNKLEENADHIVFCQELIKRFEKA